MGISERKERDRQRRIREIVDAAEVVIFSKGYKNATMDEIAEQAELSKGTLYLYFKSKEMLHLEITMRAGKILFDRFQEAVANVADGLGKVRAIGAAYRKFCVEERDYYQAMMTFDNREISPEYLAEIDLEAVKSCDPHTILTDSIKTGIKDGTIRSNVRPEETAITLWAFTNGLMQITDVKKMFIEEIHGIEVQSVLEQAEELIYMSLKA